MPSLESILWAVRLSMVRILDNHRFVGSPGVVIVAGAVVGVTFQVECPDLVVGNRHSIAGAFSGGGSGGNHFRRSGGFGLGDRCCGLDDCGNGLATGVVRGIQLRKDIVHAVLGSNHLCSSQKHNQQS